MKHRPFFHLGLIDHALLLCVAVDFGIWVQSLPAGVGLYILLIQIFGLKRGD